MDKLTCFKKLQAIKHVAIAVNGKPAPHVAFLDIMKVDKNGLYFMTSKNGRGLYNMLNENQSISLVAKSEGSFFHSQMFQLTGKIRNIGKDLVDQLLDENDYLKKIYPDNDKEKRRIIDVFQIYEGELTYQDFSKTPAEKVSFSFKG